MKRRIVSTLLCAVMAVTMVAGCGGGASSGDSTDSAAGTTETAQTAQNTKTDTSDGQNASASYSDDGKVLNIYCWNEEFKSRIKDHYPGYEETDATTGKIGDVTVNWKIKENKDNAYQNNLDEMNKAIELCSKNGEKMNVMPITDKYLDSLLK